MHNPPIILIAMCMVMLCLVLFADKAIRRREVDVTTRIVLKGRKALVGGFVAILAVIALWAFYLWLRDPAIFGSQVTYLSKCSHFSVIIFLSLSFFQTWPPTSGGGGADFAAAEVGMRNGIGLAGVAGAAKYGELPAGIGGQSGALPDALVVIRKRGYCSATAASIARPMPMPW